MPLFGKLTFARNKTKILYYAGEYIERFAKEYTGFIQSDKKDIMNQISLSIDSNYDSLSTVNENSEWYIQEAVAYISHATYDLLVSGKYDIGPRHVDPFSYKSIWGMHKRALFWALERGLTTQEDIEEDEQAYHQDHRSRYY